MKRTGQKIMTEKELILESLKFELRLINSGIYKTSVKNPHDEPIPLIDSPTCLNYQDPTKSIPCEDGCVLMHFVPEECKTFASPCHHIPLNEHGDTLASLARIQNQPALVEAIKTWLENTIKKLEREQSPAK